MRAIESALSGVLIAIINMDVVEHAVRTAVVTAHVCTPVGPRSARVEATNVVKK